jgi:hypothetical protein
MSAAKVIPLWGGRYEQRIRIPTGPLPQPATVTVLPTTEDHLERLRSLFEGTRPQRVRRKAGRKPVSRPAV